VNPIRAALQSSDVLITVGSGGVGKTTVAASLALRAAMEGQGSLVCTIDPAKRLANALGLQALGNAETEISPATFAEFAKATAEQVASNDILRHALSALRIQSLLFIVLLLYRLTSIISKKSNLSMFYTNRQSLSIKTSPSV
jgi:Mrp family chromosome partitioning ATPase